MIATPTLDGVRIRLEPMTLEHLAGLEAVAFDDRIWRHMTTWVKNRDDLKRWVESALQGKAAGTVLPWVTVLNAGNRIIGSTRFLDFDQVHKTTEIGYTWLAPEFHGSGLNAEAKLLQLRFAFDELGLNRVALKTHHENLQSQAAMRKIGAIEEGTFRNHYVMPDGSARHSVWFSIIREEWPRVRSLLEAQVARAFA
jgi:RimJ/RimL family protein N-acetyltransferase